MTTKELITELQKLPENYEVKVMCIEGNSLEAISDVTSVDTYDFYAGCIFLTINL